MNKTISKLSPLTEASYYVLLAVQQPIHGYGIIKTVDEITEGRLVLAAGTLYGVLQNLEKFKCIELIDSSSISRKKKQYKITTLGTQLLHYEITRLKSMIQHAIEMEDQL